jgi:hypothetical protein
MNGIPNVLQGRARKGALPAALPFVALALTLLGGLSRKSKTPRRAADLERSPPQGRPAIRRQGGRKWLLKDRSAV